jgi:hypothetical protein
VLFILKGVYDVVYYELSCNVEMTCDFLGSNLNIVQMGWNGVQILQILLNINSKSPSSQCADLDYDMGFDCLLKDINSCSQKRGPMPYKSKIK